MPELSTGLSYLRRGDPGYEAARCASSWNGLKPDRYPEAIVTVRSTDDVIAAVKLARDEDRQVTVRSGGHLFSAAHLRDGAVLVDMSQMTDIEIDAERRTAWVAPGVKGQQLIPALRAHDLYFTTGHCNDVAMGGFTLGGGWGWMSRVHGFACQSVLALEVVTADGELVRADSEHNADLLWAARGAGHAFFGVVTRYLYRVYPAYPVTMISTDVYPRECFEDVFRWLERVLPTSSRALEIRIIVSRREPEVDGVALRLVGVAFAQSRAEAAELVALIDSCPARNRSVASRREVELDVLDLDMATEDPFNQAQQRMVSDNMWTGATMDDLFPAIAAIADTITHDSFMTWLSVDADPSPSDGHFFSLHNRYNAALYSVWDDPADDEVMIDWPAIRIREMEHLGTGSQLNDENLGRRPAQVGTEAALARLEEIRRARDPDGRFHTWMHPEHLPR